MDRELNILVSNDDGIDAEGIRRLAQCLTKLGKVYISAPHTQRSATGHGISINKDIDLWTVDVPNVEIAWVSTGTPADCVKLGIHKLRDMGIETDMVFTGINHGGNLGRDTMYSGTVSAAAEGSFCGVQSVAVSVDSHQAKHFDYALKLALYTAEKIYGKMSPNTVININTPNLPEEEIKGVKTATIGFRQYSDHFVPSPNKEGAVQMQGEPIGYRDGDRDHDVVAMDEGYATITPIHYDITDYKALESVKTWDIFE